MEFLIYLYDHHGYNTMKNRLFRFIKYHRYYEMFKLMEEFLPSDQGRGILIPTGGDWEFILVEKTSEEWNEIFNYMRVDSRKLELPIDYGSTKNDRNMVVKFINSIPTHQQEDPICY